MVQPMLMTGYQTHTLTLSYYMYQLGYSQRWIGLSSAVALIMTISSVNNDNNYWIYYIITT
ncbi:unknown [Firmicutes bacterium CAG:449]|nr:unknown [Firmicutes bacterium CAG:449]